MESWLNAPQYEVSFIKLNRETNSSQIFNLVNNFKKIKYNLKLMEDNIMDKIERYCNKIDYEIELNIHIDILGIKHSKINIQYLSEEITQIVFCFFEGEIHDNELSILKELLKDLILNNDGIVGMVGLETVCNMIFFKTHEAYPHKDYALKNIKYLINKNTYKNKKHWLNSVYKIIWNIK